MLQNNRNTNTHNQDPRFASFRSREDWQDCKGHVTLGSIQYKIDAHVNTLMNKVHDRSETDNIVRSISKISKDINAYKLTRDEVGPDFYKLLYKVAEVPELKAAWNESLLNSLRQVQYRCVALIVRCCNEAILHKEGYTPQRLAKIIYHLAELNYSDPPAYRLIVQRAFGRDGRLDAPAIANIVKGMGIMRVDESRILTKLGQRAERIIESFSTCEIASCLAGYAMLGKKESFEGIFRVSKSILNESAVSIPNTEAIEIYHSLMFFGHGAELKTQPDLQKLMQRIDLAIRNKKELTPAQNNFELEVAQHLRQLKVVFAPQTVVEGYRIDFQANINKKIWIIECNGTQYHRIGARQEGKPRGLDIVKNRLLSRAGYSVLRIDGDHWSSMNIVERNSYLKKELKLS